MSIRQRLKNGETVVGSWIQSCSPIVAEVMARTGKWDFLCVDCEHSPATHRDVHHICQAAAHLTEIFVRLPGHDWQDAKRYLDAGVTGIIAPMVCNRQQAEQLIGHCRYGPEGERGVGFCRANGYGASLEKVVRSANDYVTLVAQIEHVDALENLDGIMTSGIDAAFIGPYDLEESLLQDDNAYRRNWAKFNGPGREIESIKESCGRAGIPSGIHVVTTDPEPLQIARAAGHRFIAHGIDLSFLQ